MAPLPQDEVEHFIASGRERQLPPGDAFCTQGRRAREIYFVRCGRW